jgi:hypothetical protein
MPNLAVAARLSCVGTGEEHRPFVEEPGECVAILNNERILQQ